MNENLITYAAFLTRTQDPPFEAHTDHQILFVTAGEAELQLPQKTLHIKKRQSGIFKQLRKLPHSHYARTL